MNRPQRSDDTSKIMILNDYGDYEYSSSAHPGLIRMGDVDGSGVIDKEDMNALVDAVYEAISQVWMRKAWIKP